MRAGFVYGDNESAVDTFENTNAGIKKFVGKLRKQKTAVAVPCVLESTGLYHLNMALRVHQAGYQVSVINPLITKKYQHSSIRNAKTDTIDALRLAEIGLKEPKLPVFSGNIQSIEAKKLICYMGKLEDIKKQIKASMNFVKMTQDITGLDIDLDHSEEAISDNVYGLSHEKVAVILSALGDKEFTSRDQLIAFVGLDVMPRQSGAWRGKGRLSKRGNSYLRKVLYQIAWGLKQNNEVFKKRYEELRAKGMNYVTSLIILARKFLRGLYAFYWQKRYPQFAF